MEKYISTFSYVCLAAATVERSLHRYEELFSDWRLDPGIRRFNPTLLPDQDKYEVKQLCGSPN